MADKPKPPAEPAGEVEAVSQAVADLAGETAPQSPMSVWMFESELLGRLGAEQLVLTLDRSEDGTAVAYLITMDDDPDFRAIVTERAGQKMRTFANASVRPIYARAANADGMVVEQMRAALAPFAYARRIARNSFGDMADIGHVEAVAKLYVRLADFAAAEAAFNAGMRPE